MCAVCVGRAVHRLLQQSVQNCLSVKALCVQLWSLTYNITLHGDNTWLGRSLMYTHAVSTGNNQCLLSEGNAKMAVGARSLSALQMIYWVDDCTQELTVEQTNMYKVAKIEFNVKLHSSQMRTKVYGHTYESHTTHWPSPVRGGEDSHEWGWDSLDFNVKKQKQSS